MGFGGGDQDLYGFTGNDPISMLDPAGSATGTIYVVAFDGLFSNSITADKPVGKAIIDSIKTPPDDYEYTHLAWNGGNIFGFLVGYPVIIKDMGKIKQDAAKCIFDGLILVGYSWGCPTLIADLGRAVKKEDIKPDLVFTIDPVPRNGAGLPIGNFKNVKAGDLADQWINWWEDCDTASFLGKIALKGQPIGGATNIYAPGLPESLWAPGSSATAHASMPLYYQPMINAIGKYTLALAWAIWHQNHPVLP